MDKKKENEQSGIREKIVILLINKFFWAGTSVLILLLVLASVLLPKEKPELPWKAFHIHDLSDDAMVQMGGRKSSFQEFVSAFTTKDGSAIPKLWLVHEVEDDRSTPLVLRPRGEELRSRDQILLGRLWVARGDRKEDEKVHQEFLKRYPEYKADSELDLLWFEAFEYLRWRMESYQAFPRSKTLSDIKKISDRLIALFEENYPPGLSEFFVEEDRVIVASLEEEDQFDGKTLESERLIIPLARVDLSVLRALSSLDSTWEDIVEFWQEKLLAARLSNGFSAYAIDRESEEYIPSYQEQFQVKTEDFLHQEFVLAETGFKNQKSRAIAFELLENDRYLRRIYHIATQMRIDEEYDFLAMNELYKIAKIENDKLTQDLLEKRMSDLKIEDKEIALSAFIPELAEEERFFSFELNAKALLSGLIIP